MVKLGKKIVSLAVVLGLTLSMGMVSFARDEVDGDYVFNSSSATTYKSPTATSDGTVKSNSTEVKLSVYDPAAYSVADAKLRTTAGLRKILGNYYREGMNLQLLHVTEVVPTREVSKANPLTVSFDVPKVSKNDTIFVLHCGKPYTDWEVIIPDAVGDECVTATFTDLSPVAFVKANRPAASGSGSGGGLSPKTGM